MIKTGGAQNSADIQNIMMQLIGNVNKETGKNAVLHVKKAEAGRDSESDSSNNGDLPITSQETDDSIDGDFLDIEGVKLLSLWVNLHFVVLCCGIKICIKCQIFLSPKIKIIMYSE
jgi:hypothetical protein